MTLRVTLLVLATGFFALIWTHDRPTTKTAIAPIAELAKATMPIASEAEFSLDLRIEGQIEIREMMGQAVSHQELVTPMPVVSVDEGWMFNDCGMPLPVGIVPGEYRAVSNTGVVREFTLTLEELQTYRGMNSEFVTRDVYQSESDALRWYFIRVQSELGNAVPVIAERGGHVVLPAIAEKSENKERQQQASLLIVNAGQEILSSMFGMTEGQTRSRITTEIKDRIRL